MMTILIHTLSPGIAEGLIPLRGEQSSFPFQRKIRLWILLNEARDCTVNSANLESGSEISC